MATVRWSNQAIEDLHTMREYLAQNSPSFAERLTDKLVARVQMLASFPRNSRMVPEFELESMRELIAGDYRIIYRLTEPGYVDISRIHPSSRPLTEL